MNGPLEVGSMFAGRFRIESMLGRGGMGTVYRATHDFLRRVVAIKVLHPSLLGDPNVLGRFQREARAAARIEHPNVTRIVDYGHSEDGIPYLVMELLEADPLSKVILEQGPMPVARTINILVRIAQALGAAHAVGVIHRDLKPANVMLLDGDDPADRVKICDFGLAKIVEPEEGDMALSAHGLGFGTPEYMSPEHCAGEPVDQRGDIYSFGLIAFALLCARPPFTGPPYEVTAAHVRKPPPSLFSVTGRTDIPDGLQQLVSRCLAKRPDDRFQSAAELVNALASLTAVSV
jgi:serine/threonine-protein kinase